MDERRSHDRKIFRQFVNYSDGIKLYQEAMSNISISGMFVRTRNRPAVGIAILLNFEIKGSPVEIPAEVVRHDMRGFGVDFLFKSEEDEARFMEELEQMPNCPMGPDRIDETG